MPSRNSKCTLVFYHRDHKERREVADLRLICRFFVFSVLFVVECVLHLEFLDETTTIHLDALTKDILRAEAIAARKSVSALLCNWIDERLDLPA